MLLQKLNAVRLEVGESLTLFGIRLSQLFSELESLEGEHAMRFTETQKLTRLLSVLRREPHFEAAYVYLQGEMTRGNMTFTLAMKTLQLQCESQLADEALETAAPTPHASTVRRGYAAEVHSGTQMPAPPSPVPALVTTNNKRHNPKSSHQNVRSGASHQRPTNASDGTVCLVLGCSDLCSLPLCRLHFASLVCGKETRLQLRDGYGYATFDKVKGTAIYPPTVPSHLLSRVGGKRVGLSPKA